MLRTCPARRPRLRRAGHDDHEDEDEAPIDGQTMAGADEAQRLGEEIARMRMSRFGSSTSPRRAASFGNSNSPSAGFGSGPGRGTPPPGLGASSSFSGFRAGGIVHPSGDNAEDISAVARRLALGGGAATDGLTLAGSSSPRQHGGPHSPGGGAVLGGGVVAQRDEGTVSANFGPGGEAAHYYASYQGDPPPRDPVSGVDPATLTTSSGLMRHEVARYSRQIIVPWLGAHGQRDLLRASVLIIGCGGLGCPLALYLASMGVGRIGLVDGDTVDESNLQRQIAHSEAGARSGTKNKADSLVEAIAFLNSACETRAYPRNFTSKNARELLSGALFPPWNAASGLPTPRKARGSGSHNGKPPPANASAAFGSLDGSGFGGFDVVADCTDNPAARYLISDACVLAGKTLVTASALGMEGQLSVHVHAPWSAAAAQPPSAGAVLAGNVRPGRDSGRSSPTGEGGGGGRRQACCPCYRCIFPQPPLNPSNCEEGGILGAVTGVMGSLQGVEVVRALRDLGSGMSTEERAISTGEESPDQGGGLVGKLLLYDATAVAFRKVQLRRPDPTCSACGNGPKSLRSLGWGALETFDYPSFCATGVEAHVSGAAAVGFQSGLPPSVRRVAVGDLKAYMDDDPGHAHHLVLDVRPKAVFDIEALHGALNVPLAKLISGDSKARWKMAERVRGLMPPPGDDHARLARVYVICRKGNDSLKACALLTSEDSEFFMPGVEVYNVDGGMHDWARVVNPDLVCL